MIPRSFVRALAAALVLVAGRAIAEETAAAKSSAPDPTTMTTYVVGFLKRGPSWTPGDSPELQKIQEGHMANIRRMHEMGKLILAGRSATAASCAACSSFMAVRWTRSGRSSTRTRR